MGKREKLEEAGVLTPGHDFPQEDLDTIEGLSDEEVDQLRKLKDKLGTAFLKKHGNPGHGMIF